MTIYKDIELKAYLEQAGFLRGADTQKKKLALRHGAEMRRDYVEKSNGISKKSNEQNVPGKEIFKPLNTGWIDENVACVREWVANIFFYRKGDTTIMIDAGYNYDRLEEKWAGWASTLSPSGTSSLPIRTRTMWEPWRRDSPGLFKKAKLYIGESGGLVSHRGRPAEGHLSPLQAAPGDDKQPQAALKDRGDPPHRGY